MARPAKKVEPPIQRGIFHRLRGRAPLGAGAALLAISLVLGGVHLTRDHQQDPPRVLSETATPSWRLEYGSGSAGSAASDSPPAATSGPAETVATDPSETVTPELLEAANRSPCRPDPDAWVDVRDFGARGDGWGNDRDAIQKANDAVAKRGGGRVVFPPGVYRAKGIIQDSCVTFSGSGGATLLHPDGNSATSIAEGRVRGTSATFSRGSRVLTVDSTRGFRPGALAAVQVAGGRSRTQRTALRQPLAPWVDTAVVRNAKGLQTKWTNHLFVGNEIISYSGISGNTLQNVKRGLFGTSQAYHEAGTNVAQTERLTAVVVRVSGKRVVLDQKARASATDAHVYVGAVGMAVDGLKFNGNRRPQGSRANSMGLHYRLARWVSVRDSTFRNGDHGGVAFDGTWDSVIEGNTLVDNGDAGRRLGTGVWLFRGALRNEVRNNTISGDTFIGILIDDRTEESTDLDADSSQNVVQSNTIKIPSYATGVNAGVMIVGSSRTRVTDNVIAGPHRGIMVAKSTQGAPTPRIAYSNTVRENEFIGNKVGMAVSGSDNEFVRNVIRQASEPWSDSGQRNRFVDNVLVR